jgi:iron complex transport system substrate-binding protein
MKNFPGFRLPSLLPLFLLTVLLLLLSPRAGFARSVVDEVGERVEVPDRPERILPLAPSIAETLFALGLDRRIVGVTQFTTYPAAARKKPSVGSFYSPSLEKILALKPDLVIVGSEHQDEKISTTLRHFGIPVYRIRPVDLETIYRMIGDLGEITGTRDRADEIVRRMQNQAAAVARRVAGKRPQKVFYQVGVDPIVAVNRHTFAADLIRRAGGRLVTADNPIRYPTYSIEKVIIAAPEVIIISTMSPGTDYQRFKKSWERWKTIPAVRNGRIYVIESDIVDRPSPRIVEGLARLADYIHGPDNDAAAAPGRKEKP